MFYTVYKVTNNINGKIYIGVHKTSNLDDSYMGSGKVLKKSIEKYGVENFTKEYLHIFDNPEDMFNMESVIVNEKFISRTDTYNLKIGGFGGWDYNCKNIPLQRKKLEKAREKFRELMETDSDYRAKVCEKMSLSIKELYISGKKVSSLTGQEFKGKVHTDETKKKIGDANRIHQQGSKNSQYGTMWIYNITEHLNKKIKAEDFYLYENKGWSKGRKLFI